MPKLTRLGRVLAFFLKGFFFYPTRRILSETVAAITDLALIADPKAAAIGGVLLRRRNVSDCHRREEE
jgi:hypothetical protein